MLTRQASTIGDTDNAVTKLTKKLGPTHFLKQQHQGENPIRTNN